MRKRDEVRELRATIKAATGKEVVSHDLGHLRKRVAMLCITVPAHRDEVDRDALAEVYPGIVAMLGYDRGALAAKCAMRSGVDVEDVVRRAVDEYLVRAGLGPEVERAKRRA